MGKVVLTIIALILAIIVFGYILNLTYISFKKKKYENLCKVTFVILCIIQGINIIWTFFNFIKICFSL